QHVLNLGDSGEAVAVRCGLPLLHHPHPGCSHHRFRPRRVQRRRRLLHCLPIPGVQATAKAQQRRGRESPSQELLAAQSIGRRRPEVEQLR
ncbi:hypothetical protein PENTCL1PPCAC_30745, partial [Pristionchus entomophagus]